MRYFAYGVTLDPARALPLAGGRAAVLDDWELVFTVPSDEWGGAVGTIEQRPGALVYGVLFDVPEAKVDDVRASERRLESLSRELTVEARIYVPDAANATIRLEQAIAFAAGIPSASPPPPSARWLEAVLAGARAHALPGEWIAELERRKP